MTFSASAVLGAVRFPVSLFQLRTVLRRSSREITIKQEYQEASGGCWICGRKTRKIRRSVEVSVHKSLIIGARGLYLELFQFSAPS